MKRRGHSVHVVTTKREYKGKVYRSHLLRRSYREGGTVRKETVANLTALGDEVVEMIRRALEGADLVPIEQAFEVVASAPHGHVDAVMRAMRRLGLAELLASRSSRQRDLCVAMVAARILEPQSKLATTRWWAATTLPSLLGVGDATEDDLYEAMDWLVARQGDIERRLAGRHLTDGGLVLYDLTSTYFEGKTCPLAMLGHNRDGKRGKLQVNFGLLTDARGCPVAVRVVEGNTVDAKTLLGQVRRVRDDFGVERFAVVGDRGMIGQRQIDALRDDGDVGWVTALKSDTIRCLVDQGSVQLDLFDERNLVELSHPDFPGERLVACRNPALASHRKAKRRALIEATCRELDKVKGMVARGRLRQADKIGVRVGKVVNKYKVSKHFKLLIEADRFDYEVDEAKVALEAALDGLYVIRTSLSPEQADAQDAVRIYKLLTRVERAFRSIKTIRLNVRPIHHRLEQRVRAHILLCMLAYYVMWHMVEVWRPLLFADEQPDQTRAGDPVAPAHRSPQALHKARSKRLPDGGDVHSLQTLLHSLSTIVRNTCRRPAAGPDEPTVDVVTIPNPAQQRALDLLRHIRP